MKKPLSRRTFLGGAGVAISLPFLESMIPFGRSTAAGQEDTPRRLVFVHVPNGMIRTNLRPREEGSGYGMPALLEPIADLREQFCILTGISNFPGQGSYTYPDGRQVSDGPGDHARDAGTFLTATRIKKTTGDDYENGISVDQVAANHLAQFTPDLPSLELGIKGGSYGGDSGYGEVYKTNISWSGPRTYVQKETDPGAVFRRFVAGYDPEETAAELARRNRLDQSVLDYCLDDVRRLERELGRRDQQRLDEYLSGIRHLETRIQNRQAGQTCDPGTEPADPGNFEEHVDLMFEMISLGFRCDRTRVVSMMLDKDGTYDFLGVREGHHNISHLEAGDSDVQKIETINRWQIEAFGSLLRKLAGTTDVDGNSLLHNSLVLFGGGLDGTGHARDDESLTPRQSGSVHRHTDLPLFLGGRGGGAVRSGRHVVYRNDEPIADLYIAMLHSVGAMVDGFGIEGTGPIGQLG